MNIQISLGATAPTIQKQVAVLGLRFKPEVIAKFQNINDALAVVYMNNLLPDREIEKAQKKLAAKVVTHLLQMNKKELV